MKVNKAFRYELKPNKAQEELLKKHAGCARFAYNWGLDIKIKAYQKTGKSPNAIKLHKALNALKKTKFSWMYEVSKCAPQEALRDLDKAFLNFFEKRAKFPKFRKKGRNDTFRLTGSIRVGQNWVKLPRIGRIKTKEDTSKFNGKILSATVKREADRWFVSILVETEIPDPQPVKGEAIGIDLGLNNFATFSDGTRVEAPKPLKKYLKRLKRLSKQHSRKQIGSNNRKKSAMRLARLHRRIKNIRMDFLHKLSTMLAKTKSVIAVESLSIKNMQKNHSLARSISDAGWYMFRKMLEYKSKWYGSNVIVIDEFMPTSKRCSGCGYVVKEMPLYKREFSCPLCGYKEDRDVNAARNILALALPRVPREVTPVEIGVTRSLKQELVCGHWSIN